MLTKAKLKKLLVISLTLAFLSSSLVMAAGIDQVTLATVPAITLKEIDVETNTFSFEVTTDNPNGTEMKIERSTTGLAEENFIEILDWQAYNNKSIFTDNPPENIVVYYRIKARNLNNIETAWSAPLEVWTVPTAPVISNTIRDWNKISFEFGEVAPGIDIWLKRFIADDSAPGGWNDQGRVDVKVSGLAYTDSSVAPSTKYKYEVWTINNGVKNIAINPPVVYTLAKPVNEGTITYVKTDSTISIGVDSPNASLILEQITSGTCEDVKETENIEAPYKLTGLKDNAEYSFRARVKSINNEYSDWYCFKIKTNPKPVPPSSGGSSGPSKAEREKEFNNFAEKFVADVIIKADGERNSSETFAQIELPKGATFISVTIDGKTEAGTRTKLFEGLKDNTEYTAKIVIEKDGFKTTKEITFKTPNRTPPSVEEVYYDQDTGDFIFKVKLKAPLKE